MFAFTVLLNMDLSKAIQDVQDAAKADTTGTGQRHVDLLESIHRLNLAAETPAETLMRMRFEVIPSLHFLAAT